MVDDDDEFERRGGIESAKDSNRKFADAAGRTTRSKPGNLPALFADCHMLEEEPINIVPAFVHRRPLSLFLGDKRK